MLCGRLYNHLMVFLKSSTVPVFVKSPLCKRTSPSGTANVLECVSLIHTNLVHSSEGRGGRVSGVYSRWTISLGEVRAMLWLTVLITGLLFHVQQLECSCNLFYRIPKRTEFRNPPVRMYRIQPTAVKQSDVAERSVYFESPTELRQGTGPHRRDYKLLYLNMIAEQHWTYTKYVIWVFELFLTQWNSVISFERLVHNNHSSIESRT